MNGRALHRYMACHFKAVAEREAPAPVKMFSTSIAEPFAILKRRAFA